MDRLTAQLKEMSPGLRILDPQKQRMTWGPQRKRALQHARCVVCVWNPAAEQDEVLRTEWRTVLERGDTECAGDGSRRGALLVIASSCCAEFPKHDTVRVIDAWDFSHFVPDDMYGRATVEFRASLAAWSREVREMTDADREFDPGRPIHDPSTSAPPARRPSQGFRR
jgi:hypothetical protein